MPTLPRNAEPHVSLLTSAALQVDTPTAAGALSLQRACAPAGPLRASHSAAAQAKLPDLARMCQEWGGRQLARARGEDPAGSEGLRGAVAKLRDVK